MSTQTTTHKIASILPNTWQQQLKKLVQLGPYFQGKKRLLLSSLLLIPVIAGLQALVPLILEMIVNDGIMTKQWENLWTYSWYFLIVQMLSMLALIAQMRMSAYLIQLLIKNLRKKLVTHIMKLKASYHEAKISGNLLTRATSDFDNITHALQHGALMSIIDIFSVFGSLIAMFILDARLALIGVIVLPIALAAIRFITSKIRRAFHDAQKRLASFNAFTGESIYQNLVIKLYGVEAFAEEEHRKHDASYRYARLKTIGLDAFLYSFIEGVASITIGITLWLVMNSYFGLENISAGVVVAFIQVLQFLFEPLKNLGMTISSIQGAFASFDRIFDILRVNEFVEGKDSLKGLHTADTITFDNVYFGYENFATTKDHTPPNDVLKNVSFSVPLGTSCALVGATGSGKSTIAKLLIKLYGGYRGSITIGNQELRDIAPEYLRERIALVSQDLTLFSGSVAFNISLGRQNISMDKVIAAAKLTGAHHFIEEWPKGYDEDILERGANLSIGEKQLISLARALCSDPYVIILDEATASIDPKTEKDFEHAVATIMSQKTLLVIAHKLSTIRHCHQIVVIHNGEIQESGNHQELMSLKGGMYAKLMAARARLEHGNLEYRKKMDII